MKRKRHIKKDIVKQFLKNVPQADIEKACNKIRYSIKIVKLNNVTSSHDGM